VFVEYAKSSDVYSRVVALRSRRIALAAAVLPLVLLIGLRSAWAAYACRIDGEIREACCCPKKEKTEKDRERAPVDEAPRMAASCCCDVTMGESPEAPQARETNRVHASGVPLALVATRIELSVLTPVGARTAWHALPRAPPRAVPTYLANRTILR
jgi:hypothetical protein